MHSATKDTLSAALIGAVIGFLAHGHQVAIAWLLHYLVA